MYFKLSNIHLFKFKLRLFKVKKHFVKHVDPEKQELEMWLEYKDIPLKWYVYIKNN